MKMGNVVAPGVFLLLGALSGPAWSQAPAGFGAVGGVIRDLGGNGMPDAAVVLSNEKLGTERRMYTTDDGVFFTPVVVPAQGYKLKVTRKDYSGWESGDFDVSTGDKIHFEIIVQQLENGRGQSYGGMRLVNGMRSDLGAEVTPEQTSETPSSGHRLDPLVALAPAVTQPGALPGIWLFHGTPYSNASFLDGIFTTNTYQPRPGVMNQLSQDAVQDFNVASATFSPEFGRTLGGVVNAATRSGTGSYHGQLYEYYRNRDWQAEDRFAKGYNVRQLQNQFGLNVGGPIRPDQVYFFLNLEDLDRNAQGLNRITNPLLADPTGTRILSSNCQATAAQCAVAARFLQSQMNVLTPLGDRALRGIAKIDYRRSARNNVSFDANVLQTRAPSLAETEVVAPNGGLLGDPTLRDQTRFAKVGWILEGSSLASNDLRVGWFQDRLTEDPVATGLSTGPLGISIAGTTVGDPLSSSVVIPSERRYQLVDNGTWTLGSHTLRAGLDLSYTRDRVNSLANAAGWYTYPSLTAFALDFPLTTQRNYTNYMQTLGTPTRTLDIRDLDPYVEDTWRANQKLTVNFGLRYEKPRLTQPTQTNSVYFQTSSYSSPYLNLGPRAGVAYALNGNTVIRAGFGFYYAPITGQLLDALYLGNAVYQTSILVTPNQSGAPSFPNIIPSAGRIPNGTTNVAYTTGSFRNPHTQEYSLSIERRLFTGTTVSLSGLHSRGFKLWTTEDYNQANPSSAQQTTETYTIDNAAGQAVGSYTTPVWIARNNANFAHVYQIENGGSSWYNAISLQLRKRMSRGLSAAATYTWSHAIDDAGQQAPFGTAVSSTFNQMYNGDKGNSAFDQRQRATVQLLWQPTVTKSNSVAARYLMNGWQFSTLTTLASSQGITPLAIVQGQQFSGVTMNYTDSLNGSGGWARVPFLPLSSLLTGPAYTVDARIARSLPITERIRAVLLFEGYNIFNMQYNTSVNSIAYLALPTPPAGQPNGPRTGTLFPVAGVGAGNASQGFPDGTNARRLQAGFRIEF
jgi:Carboxypeptidase regulatory-like domain/TonB dependent receptor